MTAQAQEPEVSIIILGFRSPRALDSCLTTLEHHSAVSSHETVVVVNGADPEVLGVAMSHASTRVVVSRANRGYAGGCNLGASFARGEFLVFLNDDAEVQAAWLDALVAFARANPAAAAITSLVVASDNTVLEAGGAITAAGDPCMPERDLPADSVAARGPFRVDYASGCSLLVRAEDFRAIAGFDERFHPAYFEDLDFSRRLWGLGREVWCVPESRVRHKESSSLTSVAKTLIFERSRAAYREKWEGRAVQGPAATNVRTRDDLRVLFVDDRVPHPSAGSGFGRMLDIMKSFAAAGVHITIHPTQQTGALPHELVSAGVEMATQIRADDYEAVIVSRPYNFEPVVSAVMGRIPVIYDAESLYSARLQTRLTLPMTPAERRRASDEYDRLVRLEQHIACTADAIIAISEDEAEWFARYNRNVEAIPPLLGHAEPTPNGFHSRRAVLYICGWLSGATSPNADGVRWLADFVLPLVRAEVPWVEVLVTGANPPEELARYESAHLRFVGEVPDLRGALDSARVCISPLRFGAGVKVKTIDALFAGVPVVSTEIGSEGIPPTWREGIAIADDPVGFARAVIDCLVKEDHWQKQRDHLLRCAATHDFNPGQRWRATVENAIRRHQASGLACD